MEKTYKAHELHPDEVTELLMENDCLRYKTENEQMTKEQFIEECKYRGISLDIPIERKLIVKMIKEHKFR